MTLAAWLHNLDPILFHIGPIPIRWYGLAYLGGFLVAFFLIKRVCRVGVSSLKPENAADLVVSVAIGIFVGGRLGYVLFYQPSLLWEFEFSKDLPYWGAPFWGALAVNHGGMASHGGMIGGIIGCLYYARRFKHSSLYLIDLFAFSAPIGIFFGRCANFINGELLGRPCSPDFVFAVKFPQEMLDEMPTEQLYQIYDQLPPPQTIDTNLQYWDPTAIIDLVHRGNMVVTHAIEPFLTPRHPSQLYAAVMEGLIVFAVLAILWAKPRKPGTIAGTFAMVYAVMRILDELFRMPDAHIMDQEFATLHITRGQWLSALLFIAGLIMFIAAQRSKKEPMGGWRGKEKQTGATDEHG